MEDSTLFLAQLMGPIILLGSVSFLVKGKDYIEAIKKLRKQGYAVMLQGIVEATAGLALVLTHNSWGSLAEVLVSLMGWALLVEGAMVQLTSNKSLKDMVMEFMHPAVINLGLVVGLAWGGYLTWFAYLA